MAATLQQVSEALGDACRDAMQQDLNVYDALIKGMVLPAVVIKHDERNSINNYVVAFSSGSAEWKFIVQVFVGQVNEVSALWHIGELVSPGSALIQALQDVFPGGTPGAGWVRVDKAGVSETTLAAGKAKYADIRVTVKT